MTNYKQLSKEDRTNIEHLLNVGKTFTEIGKAINYDRTTISKEIRRNRYIKSSTFLPHSETSINKAINSCKRLSVPPYCCNNCENKNLCSKYHLYYNAKVAQNHYEKSLIDARSGVDITEEEINTINRDIIPLVKNKKQSVNQIYIKSS